MIGDSASNHAQSDDSIGVKNSIGESGCPAYPWAASVNSVPGEQLNEDARLFPKYMYINY